MHIYNMHEAKTHLSRLIEETINGGEPFIIARSGKPLVKVTAIDPDTDKPKRRIGFMSGQIKVPDDFDTMGADEISGMFEGDGN
ncbi:MAG: type II toxin-antitoxin system Phd/YefM family antitoxin [Janthinobacterium lividum]